MNGEWLQCEAERKTDEHRVLLPGGKYNPPGQCVLARLRSHRGFRLFSFKGSKPGRFEGCRETNRQGRAGFTSIKQSANALSKGAQRDQEHPTGTRIPATSWGGRDAGWRPETARGGTALVRPTNNQYGSRKLPTTAEKISIKPLGK